MEITFNLWLVPIAVALVQVVKLFFPSDEQVTWDSVKRIYDAIKFVISLLIGIALVWLTSDPGIKQLILQGILVGLSASGLYTGTKTVAKSL